MSKQSSAITSNHSLWKKLLVSLLIITILLSTYLKLYSSTGISMWQFKWLTEPSIMLREQDPSLWQFQTLKNSIIVNQPSIFSPFTFSTYFDEEREEQDYYHYSAVTAIVSRIDPNEDGIKSVVQHLLKYPFIKEIIINDQRESVPLLEQTLQDLQYLAGASKNDGVSIYLYSTIDNMTDNSQQKISIDKFAACAQAAYNRCYFQDDLWLNTYLDSLYTHSHRYADHFVVNTLPSNYAYYMTWRFKNRDIAMHTGYGDLRYGAFIAKDKAHQFLNQWGTLNSTTIVGDNIRKESSLIGLPSMVADIYFSIWQNQYPYLVTNPLLSTDEDSFKHIDTVNNRDLVKQLMFDALSILESGLRNITVAKAEEQEETLFVTTGVPPSTTERDVRSSCANDKCLFITSINHMPNVEYDDYLEFNVNRTTVDQEQRTPYFSNISQYEDVFSQQRNAVHLQNSSTLAVSAMLMDHMQYNRAVDQDISTCWSSLQSPKSEDYFGLYMAGDIKARRLLLYTSNASFVNKVNATEDLKDLFKVTVQFVLFGSWEECEIVAAKIVPSSPLLSLITFDFECPSKKNYYEPFKSIRINFNKDIEGPFEVCSIGLDNFLL